MYDKKLVAKYFAKIIEGKKILNEFWAPYDKEDIIEIFQRIVKTELRLTTESAIRKKLNKGVISRYRLGCPLKKLFNNEFFDLIEASFPGMFKPWFFTVNRDYWNDENNIKEAVKWLVEEQLNYTTDEQKLSITGVDYENHGLLALKYKFAGHMHIPMLLTYPELGGVVCKVSNTRLSNSIKKHVGIECKQEPIDLSKYQIDRRLSNRCTKVSRAKEIELIREKISPKAMECIERSMTNSKFSQILNIVKAHDGIPKACSVDRIIELINTIIPIASKHDMDIQIMLAVIVFHDYGYLMGGEKYEMYSQKLFKNHLISKYFSEYTRSIVLTAIQECRYKPNTIPTNKYAKLLWDFKKPVDVEMAIKASINAARLKRFNKSNEILLVKNVLRKNFLSEYYTKCFFDESRQTMESVLKEVEDIVKDEIDTLNKYYQINGGKELCC